MSETTISIIKGNLLFFGVVGTVGNVSLILATIKYKKFHHNCGILLCGLAICDLTCLLFEMQSLMRMTFGWTETSMINCYYANVGYIFIENMEVWMIVALAIDRQLAISCPFSYRTWHLWRYIACLSAPGLVYGLCFSISSIFWLTDELVDPCVLPFAMPPNVSDWWNKASMLMCIITVLIYIMTYFKLYVMFPRSKSSDLSASQIKTQKAVLKTMIVQVFVFFFSSVLSALIIMAITGFGASEETIIDASSLAVIPGLISYTCNFYVHAWRSSEHRDAFIRLFLCGRTIVMVEQSTITNRTVSINQTNRNTINNQRQGVMLI